MRQAAFRVHGLDCVEEVKLIRTELEPRKGVCELSFDVLNAKMSVSYDEAFLDEETIRAAVAGVGMRAEPWVHKPSLEAQAAGRAHLTRTATTVASAVLLLLGFVLDVFARGIAPALHAVEGSQALSLLPRLLYLGAIVLGGVFVAPKAWGALRRLRPDMNLLMTVAVAGAIALGDWFEAATVAFLFSLSLTLESWSVGRARRAVAALMALSPPKARVLGGDHHEQLVDVEQVPAGSTVVVNPGEEFPLDGVIVKGESTANQAPITGESVPVEKGVGAEVFAGTINGEGSVEVRTTKPANDTTLAKIIRMVNDAQGRRARSEQWVEKFAHYYTPAVMVLAFLMALIPPLFFAQPWSEWVYRALVLLVIACPCALVISTPVSVVAALASAARAGVLIKGGLFVELPGKLRAVALDKTGTLTSGRPEVREVVPWQGHTAEEVLSLAASVEKRSEHPLAQAIVRYAQTRGIEFQAAEGFQAVRGKGATATLDGNDAWIGSHRYLEERGHDTPETHAVMRRLSAAGASVVLVGSCHELCGFVALSDRVRHDAHEALHALRHAGVEHIVMLTGDNQETAEAVAKEVGVTEVRAELMPEDKVRAVEELVERYETVAMIGDGVNDAPAMARSTLGIAMGAAGTDAALETADVALMSDDLGKLAWLVRHSRRALGIIRQNVAVSLGVKLLFVVLAFAGKATLWMAIGADMGVSLLVVFNALRLLNGHRRRESEFHWRPIQEPAIACGCCSSGGKCSPSTAH